MTAAIPAPAAHRERGVWTFDALQEPSDPREYAIRSRSSRRIRVSSGYVIAWITRRETRTFGSDYRLCMKVEEAVVHGRIGPVKIDYSEDELPLDPDFATVLLDLKRFSNGGNSGLVFRSHVTGQCYHVSPLQQDWIRRAGWCLVACPECGAAPGVRCTGFSIRNGKRPRIGVHAPRREAATAAGYGSIGWHTFRHKYITLLRGAKTPLDEQQRLARHADIRTTTQYGEVPMDNQRTANSQTARPILQRRSVRYAS